MSTMVQHAQVEFAKTAVSKSAAGTMCATVEVPFLAAMVSTGFLGPVLGAMMKQVCWHSRRSKG